MVTSGPLPEAAAPVKLADRPIAAYPAAPVDCGVVPNALAGVGLAADGELAPSPAVPLAFPDCGLGPEVALVATVPDGMTVPVLAAFAAGELTPEVLA